MATINKINKETSSLTIDPGASGDSWIQFDINGTGEWRFGSDDTDGDACILSQGSTLGTNNTFKIDADGHRTIPLQPCFLLNSPSTIVNNITGDGTIYQAGTDAWLERFDQGNNATTACVFTAPVTGKYLFFYSFRYDNLSSGHTSGYQQAQASNRNYTLALGNFYLLSQQSVAANNLIIEGKFIVDMDATDTISFYLSVSNSTKTVGMRGGSQSVINGYLLN